VQYLLLCHRINGYTNAPQCYVIRTLPVLLSILVTTRNLFGDVCCEDGVLCFDCYSIWPHPYSRTSTNLDDVHRVWTKWTTLILIWHIESLLKPVNSRTFDINPLNAELNPFCYLLALLAHHFLRVSRIRVKSLTLRLLMSYIYGAPILDVSRSHTTTHHSR